MERLRERVIDINTQIVNCWDATTRFKILFSVLDGVDHTLDIHRTSTPTDVLIDRLRAYDGPQYVVILDECDQLQETETLYDLHSIREITMILIANRQRDLFSRLDSRVASRLQTGTRVEFNAYSSDALVSILKDRVKWGLRDDVITTPQLEMIADIAAGDARLAIGILRGGAREAMQTGADEITDGHIQETAPHAKAEIKRAGLERLTEEQRLLYDIINDHGVIAPGELYTQYRDRTDDPVTNRMVRNYLSKMCQYGLITADGENRGQTYRLIE